MNELATSIISADEFLGSDKKVFATYASGLETHRNQFQPSGYDYIIHVLGYDARKEYLESFHKDDFDYVATIKENFAPWEYWIRNANWFFYRELYKDYEVVWENDYERFWQKKEIVNNEKLESELSIERIKDSKYKIKVLSPNVEKGFADVKINYNIKKDKSKHSLCTFKTIMKVDNVTGYAITKDEHDIAYYLDSKANDLFIGIPISNGYGEVILTSQPERNTYVENFFAEVNDIFVEKKNVCIMAATMTDKNWTKGVSVNGKTVLFYFSENLFEKIKKAKILSCNGIEFQILKFDYDDKWIRVTVDKNANDCQFPSEIKFLEENK